MSSNSVIGHSHIAEASPAQTSTGEPASNSPRDGLHVIIAPTSTRVPSSLATLLTPGHGHAAFVIPDTEERLPSADSSASTPGHGHGARFVFPPTHSDAPSVPAQPRPSARVTRQSGQFTTADEVHDGSGEEEAGATSLGHPLFDVARTGALPPTMEVDEPTDGDIHGRFNQPARGLDENPETEADASSRPVGGA